MPAEDGMRGSTKLAIGSVIAWFVLNLLASAQAPMSLSDPNFESKVSTGAALQSLGGIFLIVSIIAIVVTIYRNVMEKQVENRIVHGHNIEASGGAIVATDYGSVSTGERNMTEYKNYGQVGAMGDKPRSDDNKFIQSAPAHAIDLVELAKQLGQVRIEMKKQAKPEDTDHDEAIGAVASAEKAAKAGDQTSALKYLKAAGTWALKVAESVAASLVKDAIEGKIGS
jgi:hypothetical protein